MENSLKYNILIVFISIIFNFALTYIILFTNTTFLFMHSTVTILVAYILGSIYGAIVSILTNIILSLSLSYYYLYFAIINALIAIIAGITMKKFKINIISEIILGIIIAIEVSSIGTIISIILIGGTIDRFIKLLIEKGTNITADSFSTRLLTNMLYKVCYA